MRDPSSVVVAEVCYWDGYCRGAVMVSCFVIDFLLDLSLNIGTSGAKGKGPSSLQIVQNPFLAHSRANFRFHSGQDLLLGGLASSNSDGHGAGISSAISSSSSITRSISALENLRLFIRGCGDDSG